MGPRAATAPPASVREFDAMSRIRSHRRSDPADEAAPGQRGEVGHDVGAGEGVDADAPPPLAVSSAARRRFHHCARLDPYGFTRVASRSTTTSVAAGDVTQKPPPAVPTAARAGTTSPVP